MTTNARYQEIPNSDFTIRWVRITASEIQQELAEIDTPSITITSQEKRQIFIDLLIHKINHHSYGAGMHYELYEMRKQEELSLLFQVFSLSDEEISHIKKNCEYIDDKEPFFDTCECGAKITPKEYTDSIFLEGKALCASCLWD